MNSQEQKDFLEKALARLLKLIRAADAKIAPILAIDTAMLGVFIALAGKKLEWTTGSAYVVGLALILLLASLLLLFRAAIPRLKGSRKSLIFFDSIRRKKLDAYLGEVKALSDEGYIADLAEQCHQNSRIASVKFRYVRLSMFFLFLAVIPWLLAVCMLYLDQMTLLNDLIQGISRLGP